MPGAGPLIDRSRFTQADEQRMMQVALVLDSMGLTISRATRPGADYYGLVPVGSEYPVWIVMRQLDGVYQLLSGSFQVVKEATTLDQILLPGWRALSTFMASVTREARRW